MPPDVRYRDLCVSGAPRTQGDFDPLTGAALAQDINPPTPTPGPAPAPSPSPSPMTQFHEDFTGNVSGAKPPFRSRAFCMPMRDTAKQKTDYDSMLIPATRNTAFSHYLNMDNVPFALPPSFSGMNSVDVYKNTNDFRKKTFFIGGPDKTLNCPDIVDFGPAPSPAPVELLAGFQRAKAENCYNFYILNHSVAPWFTMERPGESTDDPLTAFVPDRAFLGNCQPFINGISAERVMREKWQESVTPPTPGEVTANDIEEASGFAPVWQYPRRPDYDEAEYKLSTYLQKAWNEDFVQGVPVDPRIPTRLNTRIHKRFQDIQLPCVQVSDSPNPPPPLPFPVPGASTTSSAVGGVGGAGGASGVGSDGGGAGSSSCPSSSPSSSSSGTSPSPSPGPCGATRPITDATYVSAGSGPTYYCPNVERITEPSHPYSPRAYMVPNTIGGANPALFDQLFDSDGNGTNDTGYLTDRDYSWATTECVRDCNDNTLKRGYTTYQPENCNPPPRFITSSRYWKPIPPPAGEVYREEQIREPIVQCAMVPVDILEFRDEAFENCIMQRINYNFNEWARRHYPQADTFRPPCKTKFWETDQATDPTRPDYCPVRMSIQQCCHIIIKDVVPANFIKYRTCEGLMQRRRDDDRLVSSGLGPPDITHITDERFGALRPCPPGFEDCLPVDTLPCTGTGCVSTAIDGTGNMYNLARRMTQQLNGNTASTRMQCGFRGMTGTDLIPTEPDEYLFSHYFKDFQYPELNITTPDPYDARNKFVGYHMPYMRWWDTGVSAGNPFHAGSFLNVLGGFDTLLGVGREERDERTAERMRDAVNPTDATDAGGSIRDRLENDQPSQMGRTGGWAELKAHQMWSLRRSNLFCIGRYEKLFKPGGPEQLALTKAGAGYTSMEFHQWPWSLGWRGYVTDSHDPDDWHYDFPNFPDGIGTPATAIVPDNGSFLGLDNALPGDIIVYTMNNMKYIAYVTDIGFDVADRRRAVFNPDPLVSKFELDGRIITPNRVFVVAWDQGKFPTSTRSTLNWGIGPQRTIFKQFVPTNYSEEICGHTIRALIDSDPNVTTCRNDGPTMNVPSCQTNKCQPSCEDPDYGNCVLPSDTLGQLGWSRVLVYRPYWDVRQCNGTITVPSGSTTLTLPDTYNWTGNLDPGTGLPPSPSQNVLYQNATHTVHTNVFGYCANAGWDPPASWNRQYSGAQTGAITDVTLCGPKWYSLLGSGGNPTGCAVTPGAATDLFPTGVPVPP